jgi:septal ring factor EnvC (AmiA/AmiB activator)
LLSVEELQKHELQEERNETKKIVDELKGREGELIAEIEKKKQGTKRLDNAISAAIKKEIEIARKKAEEEERKRKELEQAKKNAELAAKKAADQKVAQDANSGTYGSGNQKVILAGSPKNEPPTVTKPEAPVTTTPVKPKTPVNTGNVAYNPVANEVKPTTSTRSTSSYTPVATPDAGELTKDFETNRGKLPWPVANGVVINQFGKHKHAVATRVEIENNGIDIQTAPGAKARSVFDGIVTSVLVLPGAGSTVIINHGKYFTVYSGLSEVSVKKDDKVSSKQPVGSVLKNEDGLPILNFQVWKGGDKMNPSSWIMAM